jgi:hypothetical protein
MRSTGVGVENMTAEWKIVGPNGREYEYGDCDGMACQADWRCVYESGGKRACIRPKRKQAKHRTVEIYGKDGQLQFCIAMFPNDRIEIDGKVVEDG